MLRSDRIEREKTRREKDRQDKTGTVIQFERESDRQTDKETDR